MIRLNYTEPVAGTDSAKCAEGSGRKAWQPFGAECNNAVFVSKMGSLPELFGPSRT